MEKQTNKQKNTKQNKTTKVGPGFAIPIKVHLSTVLDHLTAFQKQCPLSLHPKSTQSESAFPNILQITI